MEDKVTRRALIEKYLNAETTPEEERRLREWFASHEADEDERDFALLVGFYLLFLDILMASKKRIGSHYYKLQDCHCCQV